MRESSPDYPASEIDAFPEGFPEGDRGGFMNPKVSLGFSAEVFPGGKTGGTYAPQGFPQGISPVFHGVESLGKGAVNCSFTQGFP